VVIYLDTSALLKLYIHEEHSEAVQKWIESQDDPLPVWDLQQMELKNALRLKVFWGDISVTQADRLIQLFEQRLRRGQYFYPDIDRAELNACFHDLSRETMRLGRRTMDVLHVACAPQLSPGSFIGFDERQCGLALHAGMAVLPARPV
jgi:predicted nucleic acid-binding protein